MATDILSFDNAAVPAYITKAFAEQSNEALASNFVAVNSISFRGKVWRINVGGDENVHLNDQGDPSATIEIVMVKANPGQSRTFYAKAFVEGEDAAPACASHDGITPDAGVESPQSDTCATCPQNVIGSRITAEGKKARACSNSKRMAVLPSGDLDFGALLLRIPSMSLSDNDNKENEQRGWYALAEYGKELGRRGVPYSAVVTKIGFDPRPSYPKLLFKAVRYLNETEVAKVSELANSNEVATLIGVSDAAKKAVIALPTNGKAKEGNPAAVKAPVEVAVAQPEKDYDPIEGPQPTKKSAPKAAAKVAPLKTAGVQTVDLFDGEPEPDVQTIEKTDGGLSNAVDDILGSIGALGTDD